MSQAQPIQVKAYTTTTNCVFRCS